MYTSEQIAEISSRTINVDQLKREITRLEHFARSLAESQTSLSALMLSEDAQTLGISFSKRDAEQAVNHAGHAYGQAERLAQASEALADI